MVRSVGEEQVPRPPLGLTNLGKLMELMPLTNHGVLPLPDVLGPRIHIVRNQKVMFDFDIAELYGVPTKVLIQAVKRNMERFPDDFMFQLTAEEFEIWRSQIVTSNSKTKMGLRRPPYAFTEHGVTMAASVLKSSRAVQMSIRIVRAFIQLRETLAAHRDLAVRIERVERTQEHHTSVINILADEIDALRLPEPDPPKRRMGFPVALSAYGA